MGPDLTRPPHPPAAVPHPGVLLAGEPGRLARRAPDPRSLAAALAGRGRLSPLQARRVAHSRAPVFDPSVLLRRLGRGGTGHVHPARHPRLGRLAAVKTARAGLQHVHDQGLVHRDVKPANLALAAGGRAVKVRDVGLARAQGDPAVTRDLSDEPRPVERVRPGLPAGLPAVVRRPMAKRPRPCSPPFGAGYRRGAPRPARRRRRTCLPDPGRTGIAASGRRFGPPNPFPASGLCPAGQGPRAVRRLHPSHEPIRPRPTRGPPCPWTP